MNRPPVEEIVAKIRAAIADNITRTGLHIQGVLDNPPFCYSIGLAEPFGFEIICVGLGHRSAFSIFNDIHASLKEGFIIELNKVYAPEDVRWVNLPIKFIKATHPFLFEEWMRPAEMWWGRPVPVYQLVLSDANGLLPDQEGYDHEYMDPRQYMLGEIHSIYDGFVEGKGLKKGPIIYIGGSEGTGKPTK